MRAPLWFVTLALAGCFSSVSTGFNDAGTTTPPPPADRLTLSARFCTSAPDPTAFATKFVLLVDQSGSMCVSDPPGYQSAPGFCDTALATLGPSVPVEPARVRATKRLLTALRQRPDVSVAMVPFASNVMGRWPFGGGFASMTDDRLYQELMARVSSLQSELGKGADFQGALELVRRMIADDISRTETANPGAVPRTRYVVLLVTDGTPFPRCSSNDAPATPFANSLNPDGQWPDSPGATAFCNTIDPMDPDSILGFVAGADRNQNRQLFAEVDQLMQLKTARRVGDIRLHTLLLFDLEAQSRCGGLCQTVHGTFPEVAPAQFPQAALSVARWLLGKLADRGSGTFSEGVDTATLANLMLPMDLGSLASQNQLKSFVVRPMTSVPGMTDRELDSDLDGVPDARETASNPMLRDSDGDCFDDGFELGRAAAGFDPMRRDPRGCDPQSPMTLNCSCRDTDGDGLSQFEESFLGTSPVLLDSDADGVHDGLEARWRLDALQATSALLDTDSDSVSDPEEIRSGSDPLTADPAFRGAHTVRYSVTTSPGPNGTTCHDFTAENLQRLPGANLFHLEVAEAPTSNSAIDYGTWRAACVWAHFMPGDGPGTGSVTEADFRDPSTLTGPPPSYAARCVGMRP